MSEKIRESNQFRRLQRNLRRRRLGGVCAGIADFLGVEAAWVRLAWVVSLFFSFSLSFWIYFLLWIFMPARPETAMPDVSVRLRNELHKIDRLVRRAHRKLPGRVADAVQDIFDAMKVLAGELESKEPTGAALRSRWDAARESLPQTIKQLLTTGGRDPDIEALREMERGLRAASREALAEAMASRARAQQDASGRFAEWQLKIATLREGLYRQAGAQARAVFERIEQKLAFVLAQPREKGGAFDLDRFDVERIAFEYLPEALNEYLRLPPAMAQSTALTGGLTAEAALTEQMIRLDNALENLAGSLFERDAQALLIHGRFLRERFADQPFRLPE